MAPQQVWGGAGIVRAVDLTGSLTFDQVEGEVCLECVEFGFHLVSSIYLL